MGLSLIVLGVDLEWYKIEGDLLYYMLYLVIGATLITVFLYQQAAINLGPKKVMAYVYLNPAVVAFLVFIFDGVSISNGTFIGIIISAIATWILLSKE